MLEILLYGKILNLKSKFLYFKRVEKRSCLNCASLAICDLLGIFKDDDGRIPVKTLDLIGSDCKKFISSIK